MRYIVDSISKKLITMIICNEARKTLKAFYGNKIFNNSNEED